MAVTVAVFTVENRFDVLEALGGKLVTLKSSVTDVLEDAGQLTYEPKAQGGINAPYRAIIDTETYWADENGIIRKGPNNSVGRQLKLVTSTLPVTYGSQQDITRGSSGYNDHADLSSLEPRDQFAMTALSAMLMKLDRPDGVNNSTILLYSRAAYRWAQGMMIAAADARALVSDEPEESNPE